MPPSKRLVAYRLAEPLAVGTVQPVANRVGSCAYNVQPDPHSIMDRAPARGHRRPTKPEELLQRIGASISDLDAHRLDPATPTGRALASTAHPSTSTVWLGSGIGGDAEWQRRALCRNESHRCNLEQQCDGRAASAEWSHHAPPLT